MSDEPDLLPIHDFTAKLRQPGMLGRVQDYVAWQRQRRAAEKAGKSGPAYPDWAPLSINLDLTTACNYACEHCIDWDILNSGIAHEMGVLERSLGEMRDRGLRSVILIGGGEPTVHPQFRETVHLLKDLGLQVAIVTNGSRNDRILDIVDRLDEHDWIRLSLDSARDATFQAMHRPKKKVTLEKICAGIPPIKTRNPAPRIGFSYVIVWQGAERSAGAPEVIENVEEIAAAASLARRSHFDYISFKPFLTRASDGAEVLDPEQAKQSLEQVLGRIRAQLDEAKREAGDAFQVIESTNLKLLESGGWTNWTRQPRTCHMQALRQVLSPLGLWNCPAHRGVGKARIGSKAAYGTPEQCQATGEATEAILDRFDASEECKEVTCLYHDTNWWIERAIEEGTELEPSPEQGDAFL